MRTDLRISVKNLHRSKTATRGLLTGGPANRPGNLSPGLSLRSSVPCDKPKRHGGQVRFVAIVGSARPRIYCAFSTTNIFNHQHFTGHIGWHQFETELVVECLLETFIVGFAWQ